MKNVDFIGKPISIDYNENTIKFSFDFIDPEKFSSIEEIIAKNYFSKVKISYNETNIVSYAKIKCWYGSIATILRERKIVPTPQAVSVLDKRFRETIFPVKYIDVGLDEMIPDVPRIHDLTDEEFGEAINTLHERHSYIDWESYKL